ncbi:NADH-quinone oxidoreductase subunit NuoE [bacterium]|nr:NADH-quinone oxidoreductase subunit NuoE [bacterium]MBU1025619.1 NADH-quinone oxidoreductase subunit NuoE [bacterium]
MSEKNAASVLEKFSTRRENLIPMLQKVQEVDGFISPEAVKLISAKLRISENEVHGVSTFYAQFRFHPPGEHSIYVCMGTACHVNGGQQILNSLEYELGIKEGQTTGDKKFDLNRVACLGCCALAPVVKIDDNINSQLSVLKMREVLKLYTDNGIKDE